MLLGNISSDRLPVWLYGETKICINHTASFSENVHCPSAKCLCMFLAVKKFSFVGLSHNATINILTSITVIIIIEIIVNYYGQTIIAFPLVSESINRYWKFFVYVIFSADPIVWHLKHRDIGQNLDINKGYSVYYYIKYLVFFFPTTWLQLLWGNIVSLFIDLLFSSCCPVVGL